MTAPGRVIYPSHCMRSNSNSEWQYQNAFVVKFRRETDLDAGKCTGRVEHIASFETARFESLDELIEHLRRMLITRTAEAEDT